MKKIAIFGVIFGIMFLSVAIIGSGHPQKKLTAGFLNNNKLVFENPSLNVYCEIVSTPMELKDDGKLIMLVTCVYNESKEKKEEPKEQKKEKKQQEEKFEGKVKLAETNKTN